MGALGLQPQISQRTSRALLRFEDQYTLLYRVIRSPKLTLHASLILILEQARSINGDVIALRRLKNRQAKFRTTNQSMCHSLRRGL